MFFKIKIVLKVLSYFKFKHKTKVLCFMFILVVIFFRKINVFYLNCLKINIILKTFKYFFIKKIYKVIFMSLSHLNMVIRDRNFTFRLNSFFLMYKFNIKSETMSKTEYRKSLIKSLFVFNLSWSLETKFIRSVVLVLNKSKS